MESSGEDALALLVRLRQLALEIPSVVGQLAVRHAGGQLVAGSGQRYTVTRAAQVIGCCGATVRRAVERGDLAGEQVESTGGVMFVVVARADLHRWAASRESGRKARRGSPS